MTNQQNIILVAIEISTSNLWELDDQYLSDAIQSQIHLLAGHNSDFIDSDYDLH